jgi:hypothetical protein
VRARYFSQISAALFRHLEMELRDIAKIACPKLKTATVIIISKSNMSKTEEEANNMLVLQPFDTGRYRS